MPEHRRGLADRFDNRGEVLQLALDGVIGTGGALATASAVIGDGHGVWRECGGEAADGAAIVEGSSDEDDRWAPARALEGDPSAIPRCGGFKSRVHVWSSQ